jgi:hypothetical protein
MPSYLSPGVYVEEVQSGARPIEGVGTAVAAFVGFAERGPFHEPTLVANWNQYVQLFGGFVDGHHLPHAVYGYFANGGGTAYVVRIGGTSTNGDHAGRAIATAPTPVALGGLQVTALPAATGDISVEVADVDGENPPEDRFRLLVRQNGEVAETFDVSTRKNVRSYVVNRCASGRS